MERKVHRMSEADARRVYNEKLTERENHVLKLKEKYGKSKGLAFGNGKLDEMFERIQKRLQTSYCSLKIQKNRLSQIRHWLTMLCKKKQ